MVSSEVIACLDMVSLRDLVPMGGTVSTLSQSFVASFNPRLLGGFGLLFQDLDFTNELLVGGCEDGVAFGQFGVADNKLFKHYLLVGGGTGKVVQRIVQLIEDRKFSGATIGEVRWIRLAGKIGAAKTVSLTSRFTAQGTLGMSL